MNLLCVKCQGFLLSLWLRSSCRSVGDVTLIIMQVICLKDTILSEGTTSWTFMEFSGMIQSRLCKTIFKGLAALHWNTQCLMWSLVVAKGINQYWVVSGMIGATTANQHSGRLSISKENPSLISGLCPCTEHPGLANSSRT